MGNLKLKKSIILEEIRNQKKAWIDTLSKFEKINNEIKELFFSNLNKKIYFIGSGSSYHISIIAKFVYDCFFNDRAVYVNTSDFIIYPNNYIKKGIKENLYFLISRTGKTTEILFAQDIIKKNLGHSIALTTFSDTELTKKCNYSIVLSNSQEKSVTATKSVTSSTLFILSLILSLANKNIIVKPMSSIINLFYKNFNKYSDIIKSIVNDNDFNKFIFLGQGPYFGVAKEAELKVKEMSLSNAWSCQSLEFRHGHKALLDKKTLIVIFSSCYGIDFDVRIISELKKYNPKILIICDAKKNPFIKDEYDYLININLGSDEFIKLIFFQIYGQLIGYHQAIKKNINPAFPKNLDFYVTFDY